MIFLSSFDFCVVLSRVCCLSICVAWLLRVEDTTTENFIVAVISDLPWRFLQLARCKSHCESGPTETVALPTTVNRLTEAGALEHPPWLINKKNSRARS